MKIPQSVVIIQGVFIPLLIPTNVRPAILECAKLSPAHLSPSSLTLLIIDTPY